MTDASQPRAACNEPTSIFSVRDLACRRGGRVVFAGLDLNLAAGAALLVQGPNGAGKSSLLRVLAGLAEPAAGQVVWSGVDVALDREAHRARVGYLGHLDGVKPSLTAREDLTVEAALRGGHDTSDGVASALAALGIADLADTPCRFFSAGQRRRLAIARLLLGQRSLWLLDEPTNGLDGTGEAALAAAVAGHRARGGAAVIASHDPLDLPGAQRLTFEAT
jgi:heme exporter protein A